LSARGLQYERLDQLTMDILLGVRWSTTDCRVCCVL